MVALRSLNLKDRKTVFSLKKLFLASTLATLSFSSFAQQPKENKGAYINIFGDYYFAHWSPVENTTIKLGESLGMGLDFGYRIDENWATRFEYAYNNFGIKGSSKEKSGNRMGFDALYHFGDTGLYGIAGLKRIDVYDSFGAVNLGLGGQLKLSEQWAVNSEFTLYESLSSNDYTDASIKLGLAYSFNKPASEQETLKPAPAPVIKDSDNDGVPDNEDTCPTSALDDLVDEKGCVKYEVVQRQETLSIFFDHDNATVKPKYTNEISTFVKLITQFNDVQVLIEGHASKVGNEAYNLKLSEKRANSVKTVLTDDFGMSSSQLQLNAKGESELANADDTEKAHAQNRRVFVTAIFQEKRKLKK